MSYQAITSAAQIYGDAHPGKSLTAVRLPFRRSRTSAALLASDPTGEALRYPFHELELGIVFQAEALAAAQFSRTPSRSAGSRYESRSRAALRSVDDGSKLPVVHATGSFPVRVSLDPERDRKRIRKARAAWAFAQGRTPWNPPAAKVPIVQAEEQQTAVTFERATGTDEPQQ